MSAVEETADNEKFFCLRRFCVRSYQGLYNFFEAEAVAVNGGVFKLPSKGFGNEATRLHHTDRQHGRRVAARR